jgi:hypothetical protein
LKMLRKRNNRNGGEYQWKSRARIGANRSHMQCIMKKSKPREEVNMAKKHISLQSATTSNISSNPDRFFQREDY